MPVTAEDLDKVQKCIEDICVLIDQVKMPYCTAVAVDEEARKAYRLIKDMKEKL